MNEYSLEQAQSEAEKMQTIIKNGEAKDYAGAEKIVEERNENKVENEPKPVALYIDDYEPHIKLMKRAFAGDNRILAIQCFSADEALKAIRENNPSILFIDNNLGGGNEGLEVVDDIKNRGDMNDMIIISITGDADIIFEYEKRGIERMDKKADFKKIKSIIDEFESKQK